MAKQVTVGEIAAKHGVTYAQAAGVVGFLMAKGQAKQLAEKRPPVGDGKGKGSTVYEIEETVTLSL